MRITPNTFKVTTWEIDPSAFSQTPALLLVHPEFGAAELLGVLPDTPMIRLGIKWYYEVFLDKKSIVKYIVEDIYWATITERNNDENDLNEMIKTSYKKAKEEFDKRIMAITLGYELHPLEQTHIDGVRTSLLKKMKDKGL